MFVRRNLCSLSLALLCATGLAGCGGGGGGEEDRGTVENSGTGADTTAPSEPGSVMVVDTAERSVQLSWSAASDDVGVTGYEILRDGQVVGSTAADVLNYTDTGLVDGVNYIYHVRARDGRGNVSAPSVDLRVVARSNADKRPPSPPSGLPQQGGTSTSITLSWQATSDNVGVTGYEIVRNGLSIGSTDSATLSFTDRGLVSGTRYSYVVRARDAAGNWSLSSAGLTASPSSVAVQDIVAPTVPSGLKVEGTSPDSVVLSWTAATDNVAVTAYDLFRDGKLLVNLNSKVFSYADTGLNASSTYTYTVQARDGAGNTSSLSAAVTAKTTAATPSKDSLAPTAPSGLAANSVGTDSLSLSWQAASDNTGVSGYDILRNNALIASVGGSVLSYTDSGLTAATAYSYKVRAQDTAGNLSPLSTALTVTTASISNAADTQAPSTPAGLKGLRALSSSRLSESASKAPASSA